MISAGERSPEEVVRGALSHLLVLMMCEISLILKSTSALAHAYAWLHVDMQNARQHTLAVKVVLQVRGYVSISSSYSLGCQ